MKLVLVSYDRTSAVVRLLSDETFEDRKAALAELERTVAEQGQDDVDLYVVDLESATPVLLLATPSAAPVEAEEPVAGAWETPEGEPEAAADVEAAAEREVESTIAEAIAAEAAEEAEKAEQPEGKPVAQAGPAITPPSSTDLQASILAAAKGLEGAGEEPGAAEEAEVQELAAEEVCVEPEMIAEAEAAGEASGEAAATEPVEAEATEAETKTAEPQAAEGVAAVVAADALAGGTPEEPVVAAEAEIPVSETEGPAEERTEGPEGGVLPESAVTWPWDHPKSEEDEPAATAVVEETMESIEITEVTEVHQPLGVPEEAPESASALAGEIPGPDEIGDERIYEPGALNMQQYTCDDCVYVNTCPNRDQKAPYECGSFQWKSG